VLRTAAVGSSAAVLLLIASALAAAPGRSTRQGSGAPPAAQASPSPSAPAAAPSPAPATAAATPAPDASPSPTPEPPVRIIRAVCTDHLCGGCDGKCNRNGGHVAVDKKGHCACTPTEGSALDRAIRQAYERRPTP
jgi:hypothetical protein